MSDSKAPSLKSFCNTTGIGYLPNTTITATDAWDSLRQWYIANGTLEVKDLGDGKTKETWNTQTTWGDHTVKGLNQILPRLLKIFPKAKRTRDSSGRNCLEGIGFTPPHNEFGGGGDPGGGGQSPNPPQFNSVSDSNNSERFLNGFEGDLNQTKPNSSNGSESREANTAISQVKNLWTVLSEEERSQLLKELGIEIGIENNSGLNSSNQLQDVQNSVPVSNTAPSVQVQTASEHIQKPSPPTVQALANQILLCQTWAAVAKAVNQDGGKFIKAAAQMMTLEQRQGLTTLLVAHLRDNPAALKDLAWVPGKLRDRALQRLCFTICRLGGDALLDACLERISGCKFVSVEHLGTRREAWVFQSPDGVSWPVFGVDAVEAIASAPQ